jgi:hypothetical protein
MDTSRVLVWTYQFPGYEAHTVCIWLASQHPVRFAAIVADKDGCFRAGVRRSQETLMEGFGGATLITPPFEFVLDPGEQAMLAGVYSKGDPADMGRVHRWLQAVAAAGRR